MIYSITCSYSSLGSFAMGDESPLSPLSDPGVKLKNLSRDGRLLGGFTNPYSCLILYFIFLV